MLRSLFAGIALLAALGLAVAVLPASRDRLSAQEATPTAPQLNVVGSWVAVDAQNPAAAPSLYTFMADGTYIGQGPQPYSRWTSTDRAGAWVANEDGTYTVTEVSIVIDEAGAFNSIIRLSGEITVSADGNSFQAALNYQVSAPDGGLLDEGGPISLSGTRIVAEPLELEAQGTPTT